MGRPHKLAGKELLDKLLVVIGLIFLGVVTLLGFGGVPVERLASILGAADRDGGVHCVELIKPGAVHSGVAAVPTEIVVVGNHVGDPEIGIVHLAHRNSRDGGQTCLIHLVAEVVEDSMVFKKILICTADADLVGETPNYDRGMVIVLRNELLHLRDGVLASAGHMLRDIGDLRPDNETALVAEIIEILIVLIVSKTDGGCTDLANEVDIFLVMLGKKRVTHAPSVLVTRYAAEGVFLTVEDKAVVGIDLEGAATKSTANVVDNGLALNDLCLTAIEVGVLAAVPKMNVLDLKVYLSLGRLSLCDLVFFLVINGVNDLLTLGKILDIYFNLNLCILAIDRGSDLDAGCAVVIKVKMSLVDTNEVYVTVKTAVEGEVRHLGVNGLIGSVINNNCDLGRIGDLLGDVYSPGRITAVVVRELLAANVNVSGGICAAEFEIIKVSLGE